MKTFALHRAVALPVALVVGLAGSALLASPASAAPAPSDLLVTSPGNGQAVHGARSITVTGQAPVGSYLFVLDDLGHNVGHTTTTATTFSIPITFPSTVSYDQFLLVKGRVGTKGLTSQSVEVVFDAPQSAAPAIGTPTTASSPVATAQPFGDIAPITVGGTGTPGDTVVVGAQQTTSDGWGEYDDFVTVDPDGTWTDDMYLDYGRWSVTARSELVDTSGFPLTTVSDASNSSVFIVTKQTGIVEQPVIVAPDYPADASSYLSFFTSSPLAQKVARSTAKASLSARFGIESLAKSLTAPKPTTRSYLQDAVKATAPRGAKLSAPKDCFTNDNCTLNQLVAEDGVQVKGTADRAHPGRLKVTISGTGTPGDAIALYINDPESASTYLAGLYPAYFAGLTGTEPGKVTSHLPGWNHQIAVHGNHRWSGTLYLKPGPFFITAFDIRGATSKHPAYSLAGNIDGINVAGKPSK